MRPADRSSDRSRRLKGAGCAGVAAVGLLTLPELATHPAAGIDPSWELGLHLSRDHGFVVGRDIVFNYGPWGFLNVPLTLSRPLWLAAVVYRLVVQVGLFAALVVWGKRHVGGGALLATLPILLFLPSPEYRLLLALVLWTRLVVDTTRERPLWAGSLGFLGAATTLVKFSMGLTALLVVAGGVVAAWWQGRRRTASALVLGFGSGIVVCGLAALGSLRALGEFLSASLEISTSYGFAMERRGPSWQPVLVLVAVLLLAIGSLRDRSWRAALVLPSAGLLLITFKHAFIRHETHGVLALGVGSAVMTWIALESARHGSHAGRVLRATGALALVAGALIVIPPTRAVAFPSTWVRSVGQALVAERETRDPSHRARIGASLRRTLPLHERARELIGDRTVDILTVEVAMVEAWNLNWAPRRVLQSYAVGTRKLDDLDAAFFAGPSAPERLLVDLQGLDTRHPFMDAPRTWREILSRYVPLGRDRRWVVLGRREHPLEVVERPLRTVEVPMNHLALAPRPETGHLEMRVRLVPTLLGRLVSLPWKIPEIRLGLASSDAPTPARRILPGPSNHLFPLTREWPDSPEDLWALYAADRWPSPHGVAFVTQGSWAWNPAEVDFYEVSYLER